MKRYITVNARDLNEVLALINNAAGAVRAGNDAYHWLKTQLQNRQVGHHDRSANHQNELPHQGGYASFYLGSSGRWMYVQH